MRKSRLHRRIDLCLDLELTLESLLLGDGLELAVTELGGCIDESEVGNLEVLAGCVGHE